MAYIGSAPTANTSQFSSIYTQSFNGTGSATSFTLNRAVASVNNIEVVVNNVQQSPFDGSYTVTGLTTLLFSEAPSSGTNNIYVIYRDQPLQSITDTGAVRRTGDTMTGQLKIDGPLTTISPTARGIYAGYDPITPNNIGLEIVSGTNGISWLDFSDGNGSDFRGRVAYNNSNNTLEFGTNGISRASIDSAGRLTVLYQPMFCGFRSTSPNTIGAGNVVIHNSVITDIGSCYSQSTGRFTCPVAGKYLVSIEGHAENSQPTAHNIRKNGTSIAYTYASVPSGSYAASSKTLILNCAVNDYIDHYISSGTLWCGDASGVSVSISLIA